MAETFKGQARIVKINVDNSPASASRHGVRGVPAMFFYRRGVAVDQAVGAVPKSEIERRIRAIIQDGGAQ
ncbi:MAG: thioredoxin family protein [Syntrophorhabdaceae bacterium]|nr:thioredoxin family protein [Syntrophorhabdaceae bacterium]